ncbi:MAG: FAD-dependent monooxygenase [Bacteroidota bacterium]
MNAITTDVLIIGGGPSGMVSALFLDKLGISSKVIERRFDISPHPKAHELSARSMEILLQLGISLEELTAEAASYRDGSRILFGHTINQELGEIDLWEGGNDEKYKQHLAAPVPYLNLSQTELEKILRAKLSACSHSELLVGHQWEEMQEHAAGMSSKILDRNTQVAYTIESQYVVCADGAASRSREALGIRMIGKEKINDFISVYFELGLRDYLKKTAKLYWIMNPKAPGTFIAHHIDKRWVYHFPIFTPYEKREDYTEEILQDRILTALGHPNISLSIHSVGLWRMTHQMASRFQKGRAFLVGDAAHRFPPTGGLGMNSGIGDAQNLMWKLAMVIKGLAAPDLLATYEAERRPVIEQNSRESMKNYHKIFEVPKALGLPKSAMKWQAVALNSFPIRYLPKSWVDSLLKKIQRSLSKKILAVPQKPPLHQKIKAVIKDQIEHFDRIGLDLGYAYRSGSLISNGETPPPQTVSAYRPSVIAGVRFPHFWIESQKERFSSHAWLAPNAYTLLVNHAGENWWKTNRKLLPPSLLAMVQCRNVENMLRSQPASAPERAFYPIEDIPLLLIRPDGHVAWKAYSLESDIQSIFHQLIPAP